MHGNDALWAGLTQKLGHDVPLMGFNLARKKSWALQMLWQLLGDAAVDVRTICPTTGERKMRLVPAYAGVDGVDEGIGRITDDEWKGA